MIKQLTFGFDNDAQIETDPLFLAAVPDEETAQRVEQLAEHLRKTHGLTGVSRPFHVTLCEINARGGAPRMVEKISEAATAMTMRPFTVALDRVMSFGKGKGDGPVVLAGDDGAAGLIQFRKTLCFALQKAGLGKWPAKYNPHLTLLYDTRAIDERVDAIHWTVREFVLLQSLVGQTKHVPLGRWPLGG